MIRKLGLALVALVFCAGSVSPLSAADIPDEQLVMPAPPVSNQGGYSGAYFDDQRTLYRAFTYLESWESSNFATTSTTTCESAQSEPCKSSSNLFFETPLSPCSDLRSRDCVVGLSGRVGENPFVNASLVETLTSSFSQLGTDGKNRYNTPFKGDINRGIPDSGQVSLWTIPGLKHQGGDLFLLIPKLNAEFQNLSGSKPSNLDVGIYAVSRLSNQGVDPNNCFFNTKTQCFKRWGFPENSSFKVSIKTGAKVVGWFHGRLTSPEVSSEKLTDGQTLINVEGSVMKVPTLAVWAKNSDLPTKLNEMIEKEFVERGYQFAGTCLFSCETKDRSTQTVIDERNPSFNNDFFERYMLWVGVAKDKAFANVSTWSFRTMQNYQDFAKCIGESGVAGMVTTNSNAYIAGPPKFQDGDLAYRVASPHYDAKGEVQIGTYDLAIRSDVARCIYGFSSAPIQATLSVVYADGEAKKATTLVSEKNNWLRLSAKGFTYSSPVIKVKLTQESAAASPKLAKKSTITCVKGKTTKKVTAVNPKCPTGYKKK